MRKNWFRSGQWNVICDVCGLKYKNTDLQKRWDGLMVCSQDWEQRHPQELIRPIADEAALPWTRPESKDQFIEVPVTPGTTFCGVFGVYCQADYAQADCAIVGMINEALVP